MASLEEIKAEIKTIAEAITDIGTVYAQMPHIKTWDKVFAGLVEDKKLKVLTFTKISRQPEVIGEDKKAAWEKGHKFFFKYIYSASVEGESDKNFDEMCEDICDAFDSNSKLNGKVKFKSLMSQQNKGFVMTCGVLCHYAEFEFTTTSYYN